MRERENLDDNEISQSHVLEHDSPRLLVFKDPSNNKVRKKGERYHDRSNAI